jgi:hypothetical protein
MTLGLTPPSRMALNPLVSILNLEPYSFSGAMTISITAFATMTLSILLLFATLGLMSLSVTVSSAVMLSIAFYFIFCHAECYYDDRHPSIRQSVSQSSSSLVIFLRFLG